MGNHTIVSSIGYTVFSTTNVMAEIFAIAIGAVTAVARVVEAWIKKIEDTATSSCRGPRKDIEPETEPEPELEPDPPCCKPKRKIPIPIGRKKLKRLWEEYKDFKRFHEAVK